MNQKLAQRIQSRTADTTTPTGLKQGKTTLVAPLAKQENRASSGGLPNDIVRKPPSPVAAKEPQSTEQHEVSPLSQPPGDHPRKASFSQPPSSQPARDHPRKASLIQAGASNQQRTSMVKFAATESGGTAITPSSKSSPELKDEPRISIDRQSHASSNTEAQSEASAEKAASASIRAYVRKLSGPQKLAKGGLG